MIEQHWQGAFELFSAAAPLDAEGRRALLEASGAGDTIITEVRSMLAQLDSGVSFTAPVAENPPLAPGTRVGRNEITGEIGRGGMSRVYSAYDPELDRTVAVKLVSPSLGASSGSLGHPVHEARTASALNHPNVVTVHEVIPYGDGLAIVMELIEGQTLRSFTAKPMPLDRFLAVATQLAEALTVAHAQSIVHRDIKPENVMVRRDGYVKVLDFGLARRDWVIPGGGRLSGTPRYMSPEQAAAGELTPATDIFSLGLVLYELATGVYPFAGAEPVEIMHAIVTTHPRPPAVARPGLPAALNTLLLEMLRKEPDRRPPAAAVAARLAAIKQGNRKWQWLLAAAGVAALTALTAAGSRSFFRPPPEPVLTQITNHVTENRVAAAAVTADGARLAYATSDAVFIRNLAGGETATHGAPAGFRVDRISWFPDRASLLLSGTSASTQRVALWKLTLGPPAQLVLVRDGATNGVVSRDGSRLAFTSDNASRLWVSGASGENPAEMLAYDADDFAFLLWTPAGRLAYSRRYNDPVRKVIDSSFETIDVDSRKVLSRWDHLPMQSAVYVDGPKLLFLGLTIGDGTYRAELWSADADPRTGAIVSKPRQLTKNAARLTSLSASGNGRTVSVVNASGNQAVFVGEFDARTRQISQRRRLVLDDHSNYPHAWSPDGQYVVYESIQKGPTSFDLFRHRLDRTFRETVIATPGAEYMPRLTPDGRWYLYSRAPDEVNHEHPSPTSIMRIPVGGGTPAKVYLGRISDEFRCATVGRRAAQAPPCVLSVTDETGLIFYAFDPERGKGPELRRVQREAGEKIFGDWELSPDGTRVAIPCHQRRHAHVQVIPLSPTAPVKNVVLPGLANLSGVSWLPDGRGWFITFTGALGWQMAYSDFEGHATTLGVRGWAVPSPIGNRIAFLDYAIPSNVFFIDQPHRL